MYDKDKGYDDIKNTLIDDQRKWLDAAKELKIAHDLYFPNDKLQQWAEDKWIELTRELDPNVTPQPRSDIIADCIWRLTRCEGNPKPLWGPP